MFYQNYDHVPLVKYQTSSISLATIRKHSYCFSSYQNKKDREFHGLWITDLGHRVIQIGLQIKIKKKEDNKLSIMN